MTKWLEAAKKALPPSDETDITDKTYSWARNEGEIQPEIGVSSVLSVLSGGGIANSQPVNASLQSAQKSIQQKQSSSEMQTMFRREWKPNTKAKPDDAETYAEELRKHGAMSYGMAMRVLGWGGTRASQAEDALRLAGRIVFNSQGRAVLSDNENHQSEVAQ